MKVLLTGGSGQLGTELCKLRNYWAPPHEVMDITDEQSVYWELSKTIKPDLIVHAAAYTDTSKPDNLPQAAYSCFRTNVLGTRYLVKHAQCPIIFISTETALEPYNFYAITKVQAELEIRGHRHPYLIVRTSFRDDPFEYPKAATDMYTIADTVQKIAPLIDALVDQPFTNTLAYIGTGCKTVYELARQTRPDVVGLPRAEIDARLPEMRGLLNV